MVSHHQGSDPKPRKSDPMISQVIDPPTEAAANHSLSLPRQLEGQLLNVFKQLSDKTRLRILLYLMEEKELHVTALCERLGQSQPAVSHHLALLRATGLIEARRDGKHNYYSVCTPYFHSVIGDLFQNISDPKTEEIRFDEYVLSQQSDD